MGPSTDGILRPKCKPATLSVAGFLLAALLSAQLSDLQAGEPPENSIPIIAMKAGQGATSEDISITFLCELLWNYFDGFQIEGWTYSWDPVYDALELGDSTGVLAVLGPSFLGDLESVPARRWGRYDGEATLLDEDSAFVRPNTDLTAFTDAQDAPDMIDTLHWRCVGLAESVEDLDCIWYYDIFNEGPSWQLLRMNDTLAVSQFYPSMFTQDTSLSTMDTDGVFSWVKWKSDSIHDANNAYTPPVSVCFGGLHTIEDDTWADYPGITLGVFHTQASSVRAYFNTRYQEYDDPLPDTTYANYPASLDFNAYPIRLVGHDWQVSEDSTATLGGELDQWMLDHFESIMDSTFIPAADDSEGPFPVHYHPQAFGRTGGEAIWEIETVPTPDTTIAYTSYSYRIPSPAELRMLCNLGLIRQAKGVFPYSIRSYSEWDGSTLDYHDSGLLDEDLIAFDAPYEEWVYRERPSGDFYYAPPDSIPPWTDVEGNDFDPLYELPARQNWSGEQATQDYLVWKFQAYARLWNSLRDTFGEIARVAPELSGLWWYDGYEDRAEIALADSSAPTEYLTPEIRGFGSSTDGCYLFYVNRYCRGNGLRFTVRADEDSFPSGALSEYALDHHRRVIIPVDETSGVYTFTDTLDAGQPRLVEFVDTPVSADARLTRPDVHAQLSGTSGVIRDFRFTVGDSIDIYAVVYNMGTQAPGSAVPVTLYDITESSGIDSTTVTLPALSTSGYTTASDTAAFSWTPGSPDIGVHVLEIRAHKWAGEPDTLDNRARVVFLIDPRDYATGVLEDAWDMTEGTGGAPDWKTDDISGMRGWESYSDSISGMFEGSISDPSSLNRMVLNTGSGASDSVDTSAYDMLSLAGKASRTLDIDLYWIDASDDTQDVDLGIDLTTDWEELGPVDLDDLTSGTWSAKKASTVWLEFGSGSSLATPVRIGWIRLTE